MMRLNVFQFVMPSAGPHAESRPEVSDQDRKKWVDIMRQHFQGAAGVVEAELDMEGDKLHMQAERHGTAIAAIWKAEGEPVAASVFLHGQNGADDVAAVGFLQTHQPELPFEGQHYNMVLAQNRPCLAILYLDSHWLDNSKVDLAASALMLAFIAKPGADPKMEPERELTPEEQAMNLESVNRISRIFATIQRNWALSNRLDYRVVPSEAVKDRPVEQIMHVRFWTGVGDDGEELSIDELVGVFLMLKDFVEQAPGMKNLKEPKHSSTVTVRHSPDLIAAVLRQVQISEPGPFPQKFEVRFNFTPERFQLICDMVKKKANAALTGRPGMHFRVYPPQEYLNNPAVVQEAGVFDKLKDTVWWVWWYDGVYDQLSFGEFLGFIHEIIQAQQAFQAAARTISKRKPNQSKHAGGWQPKKDRSRKPTPGGKVVVEVKGGLNVRELVSDSTIQKLFKVVDTERTTRPPEAVN